MHFQKMLFTVWNLQLSKSLDLFVDKMLLQQLLEVQ